MAKRNVLHKNLLEDFQKWLVADGWEIEKPKGTYEVLRARKDGRPQPLIVYMKADAKEHLTVMDRDFEIVRAFLRDKKKTQTNADRIRSMPDEELAKEKRWNAMENRYLFRGKRIDTGEWVEGYLSYPFCTKKGNESYYFYAKDSLGFFCRCVVDASTICRCTGRNDKNGKVIWENDIVNCLTEDCSGYIDWNESEAGFYFNVLLEDGSFEEEHIYDYQDCIEVIGNTFDNLELLEV